MNCLFGVHKRWVENPDGGRLQVLRLITNLIPSNSLLRAHVGASHEELVKRASMLDESVHCDRLMGLNRLFPSSGGPWGDSFHSVYVDNWDQFRKVAASGCRGI